MVVNPFTDTFVVDFAFGDWHPTRRHRCYVTVSCQLTLLDLQMNDSVLFNELNSRYDPKSDQKLLFLCVKKMKRPHMLFLTSDNTSLRLKCLSEFFCSSQMQKQ